MKRTTDVLQSYAEATTARAEAVDRVIHGVLDRIEPDRVIRLWPTPPQVPWRRVGWSVAAALVVAALVVLAATVPRGPPSPQLLASDQATDAMLAPGVHATFQGHGRVEGQRPMLVHWDNGRIELSVDPGANRSVSVRTTEAVVQVVGTLFTVNRDGLGTHVRVSHGTVAVTCSGQDPRAVSGGQSHSCLPVTAPAFLGRAEILESLGAPSEEVLEAVDAGLSLGDQGPATTELQAFRIQHLLRVGQHDEARVLIDAYLAKGTTLRRSQMLRARARMSPDCLDRQRFVNDIPRADRQVEDEELLAACP